MSQQEIVQQTLKRLEDLHPDFDPQNAEVILDGLVNVIVLYERNVYRFARDEGAINLLHREYRILELIRKYIEIPAPHFKQLADDCVSYPFLDGKPLFRNDILNLSIAQQDQVANQLATFLKQLHTIPHDQLIANEIQSSGGNQTRNDWLAFYEQVQRELFPLMYRSTQTWVKQHFAPLLEDNQWLTFSPALIHDDLAQYHILFDLEDVLITGIIDFGTAGFGDPARDYGILLNVYGEALVKRMATYDERIGALIDRARFYAGTYELQWLLGGVRSGDNSWFTAHIDRAKDISPYGIKLGT